MFLTKRPQWRLLEQRRTELGTSNWPWNSGTHLKCWPKDDVALKILEGRVFEKRYRSQPKFSKGIKVRGRKEQLRPERTRPVAEAVRQALALEVVKLEAWSSIRKRKTRLPTAGVPPTCPEKKCRYALVYEQP
jgi:hypothetical protein